jgi:hypothetical protein
LKIAYVCANRDYRARCFMAGDDAKRSLLFAEVYAYIRMAETRCPDLEQEVAWAYPGLLDLLQSDVSDAVENAGLHKN